MSCDSRRAWLTLGGRRVELHDEAAGYFCTSLDLGYPDVRTVTSNRPAQDGIDDRTQFFGGRTVTAKITAVGAGGRPIDAVAASFAPFMTPAARPVLHYVLDRPGAPERQIVVRAAGYAWPIEGADQRQIQLQWVAADPIMRDPTVRSTTAWSGSSITWGRTYDLTFDRQYDTRGGGAQPGTITSAGDVGVRPVLRVFGPITGARVSFQSDDGTGARSSSVVGFAPGYEIGPGDWREVDTAQFTAVDSAGRSVLTALDWPALAWPYLPPEPGATVMTLSGDNMTGATQVRATWQDGYLT
jgi:hypothetical protein